jgi:hypothetical protein
MGKSARALAVSAFLAVATLASELGAGAINSSNAQNANPPSTLAAGSALASGQSLTSPGGRYKLSMETDGNLVLHWLTQQVWDSNTSGHAGADALMQRDGNFVVYLGKRPLWSSGSGGHPRAAYKLSLLDAGDFVIDTPTGAELYSSRTETAGVRIDRSLTPAFDGDAGDPDIVRFGTTYYAFTTGTALGNHIQVLVDTGGPASGYHSYTGEDYGSTALPDPPAWEQPNTQTSPGVVAYGGQYVMFYDASMAGHPAATGYDCISVATARTITPEHPVFSDDSKGPLICDDPIGVLDPTPFVDSATGKAYLLWKSNDGASSQASHIWSQELNSSGTGVVGSPVDLLTVNTVRFRWETTLDDPFLAFKNGRYFLMFSSGLWHSSSYDEAFAICSGPARPCEQPAGGPFLTSYGAAYGTGGGSLFTDTAGNWWIAYAAWDSSRCQSYSCGAVRVLYVSPIDLGANNP